MAAYWLVLSPEKLKDPLSAVSPTYSSAEIPNGCKAVFLSAECSKANLLLAVSVLRNLGDWVRFFILVWVPIES